MRRADLRVGEAYRLHPGTRGGEENMKYFGSTNDNKCIVLDTNPGYISNSTLTGPADSLWAANEGHRAKNMGRGTIDRCVRSSRIPYRANRTGNRVYVAVEIPVTERRLAERVTGAELRERGYSTTHRFERIREHGEPTEFFGRYEYHVVENVWVPFAALTKDILEPWRDFEIRVQSYEVDRRLAQQASEKAERQRAREKAEQEAKREEESKQNKRRHAASKEFYEVRILPTLGEALGEDPHGVHFQFQENTTATITLSFEQAQRLVEIIQKGQP